MRCKIKMPRTMPGKMQTAKWSGLAAFWPLPPSNLKQTDSEASKKAAVENLQAALDKLDEAQRSLKP